MSVNQNQQINVFNKGMNTDTSDAYLSNEQYRYAENLRFITNTGENSGELRLIEGYKEISGVLEHNEIVVAVTSVRNLLIMLTNKDGKARIHVWNEVTNGIPFETNERQWNKDIRYSLVTRWESNDNIKLYIADGEHELMSLNVAVEDRTYKSFKQLTGEDTEGNHHQQMEIELNTGGKIKSPVFQYAYQLYTPNEKSSDLSPLSEVIRVYNGDYGFSTIENSNAKTTLSIPINDNSYTHIRIFRIEYEDSVNHPVVYLICDEKLELTDGLFEYVDEGGYIVTFSLEELLALIKYRFSPRLIESKNDYLFAANVQSLQDNVDQIFKDVEIQWEIAEDHYNTDRYGKVISGSGKYGSSLMRGEKYRYGVIFYTDDGLQSSVKYIGEDISVGNDKQFVEIYKHQLAPGHRPEPNVDYDSPYYKFTKFGVKFTLSNIPDKCAAYEIVRCNRTLDDSYTISQGIIGATYGKGSGHLRFASSVMTLQNNECAYVGSTEYIPSQTDLLMFASPESSYQMDDCVNAVENYKNSIYLEPIQTYDICDKSLLRSTYMAQDGGTAYIAEEALMYAGGSTNSLQSDDHRKIGPLSYVKYWTGSKVDHDGNHVEKSSNTPTKTSIINNMHEYNPTVADGCNYNFYSALSRRTDINLNTIGVSDFSYVYSPDANKFSDGESILIGNDSTVVGNFEYINWDAYPFMYSGELNITNPEVRIGPLTGSKVSVLDELKGQYPYEYKISSGKKCLLFKTNMSRGIGIDIVSFQEDYHPIQMTSHMNQYTTDISGLAPVTIANLKNKSCIPYGGTSKSALNLNTYFSHGNYKKYTKNQTNSSSITVFDGDVYNNMFVFISSHAVFSDVYFPGSRVVVYSVPVESRIDLAATYGSLPPKIESVSNYRYLQDVAGEYKRFSKDGNTTWTYVQKDDAYLYNTVYSWIQTVRSYTSENTEVKKAGNDTRIHYSDPKTNGEAIDSWTNFKAMNFLDVDTRYGEITQLKLFKNALMFWQKNAVGILAVNERTMLQDVNNTNIILGNGDVLQRYDYLSTKYGMAPNQLCDVQSDISLYWWDKYNRDIIQYPGGQQVVPMKIAKTVSNYINRNVDVTTPALAYDGKYKEILASVVYNSITEEENPLAYNELVQQFTSVYSPIEFKYSANIQDALYLISESESGDLILKWNEPDENHYPKLKYVVNDKDTFTKVYDNVQIGMGESFYYREFYNGDDNDEYNTDTQPLTFTFDTIEQHSQISKNITNREYDLRFAVPRNAESTMKYANNWGERMRGRTMQCELTSSSSSTGFSIQYIITKYRISWS